jgi:uridine nucleosidase
MERQCDPEAAGSIFSSPKLAAKTTLITLDITHQALATDEIIKMLRFGDQGHGKPTAIRHLFFEILTFFASTYEREFSMGTGPPLHDPLAVAAALCPSIFDDNDGERYDVYVVKDGDDSLLDHSRTVNNVGQCGRTIARLLAKGEAGVRIPRTFKIPEFWHMIDLSLAQSEETSPLTF